MRNLSKVRTNPRPFASNLQQGVTNSQQTQLKAPDSENDIIAILRCDGIGLGVSLSHTPYLLILHTNCCILLLKWTVQKSRLTEHQLFPELECAC